MTCVQYDYGRTVAHIIPRVLRLLVEEEDLTVELLECCNRNAIDLVQTALLQAIVVRLAITLPAPKAFGDDCFDLRLLRAEYEDAVVCRQHIGRLDLGKGEVKRLHRCEQRLTTTAHGVYKHVP